MNRKQKRALKKMTNDKTTQTLDLMLNMPKKCLTCDKPYDRMSKEMVKSWFVEVFNKEKIVNLYCPECFHRKKENGV